MKPSIRKLSILMGIYCIPFISMIIWMIYKHYQIIGMQANYTMLMILGVIGFGWLGAYLFEHTT